MLNPNVLATIAITAQYAYHAYKYEMGKWFFPINHIFDIHWFGWLTANAWAPTKLPSITLLTRAEKVRQNRSGCSICCYNRDSETATKNRFNAYSSMNCEGQGQELCVWHGRKHKGKKAWLPDLNLSNSQWCSIHGLNTT